MGAGAGGYAQMGAAGTGGTLGGIGDIIEAMNHEDLEFPGPSDAENRLRGMSMQDLLNAQYGVYGGIGNLNQTLPALYDVLPYMEAGADPEEYAAWQGLVNDRMSAVQRRTELQSQKASVKAAKADLKARIAKAKGADKKALKEELKSLKAGFADTKGELKRSPKMAELRKQLQKAQSIAPPVHPRRKSPTVEDLLNQHYQNTLTFQGLMAALGRPDFDPFLTQQLQDQEDQMNETMRRNLGEDYETSSPGIEARARFQEQRDRVLGDARIKQMQQLRQLQLGGAESLLGQAGTKQGQIAFPHREQITANMSLVDLADAATRAQSPLQFDRSGQYSADTANWGYGDKYAHGLKQSGDRWIQAANAMGGSGGGGGGGFSQGAS